jgi:hypothetical protein
VSETAERKIPEVESRRDMRLRRSDSNRPTVSSIQQAARSLEYCSYDGLDLDVGNVLQRYQGMIVVDWHIDKRKSTVNASLKCRTHHTTM